MMNSTTAAVTKRIRVHGRGWTFTPKDFPELGSREAIHQTLSRLTRDNVIRRIARGVYDYPRVHKQLGVLAPRPDDVAAAVAAKTGTRIQVSGARAANLLGLTDQVPAQIVYLTDGRERRLKVGSQTIHFKRVAPSKLSGAGTRAGLALQALRAIGPQAAHDQAVVARLANALDMADRRQLRKLGRYAPGWAQSIIRRVADSTSVAAGD